MCEVVDDFGVDETSHDVGEAEVVRDGDGVDVGGVGDDQDGFELTKLSVFFFLFGVRPP